MRNGWASRDLKALEEIYQAITKIEDASLRSYFSSDDQTKSLTDAYNDHLHFMEEVIQREGRNIITDIPNEWTRLHEKTESATKKLTTQTDEQPKPHL